MEEQLDEMDDNQDERDELEECINVVLSALVWPSQAGPPSASGTSNFQLISSLYLQNFAAARSVSFSPSRLVAL